MGSCPTLVSTCHNRGGSGTPKSLFFFVMFVICPASFDLVDAEWFDNVYEAKEEALDWSAELAGRNVIVYEALEDDDGAYDFKPVSSICA